MSQSFSSTNGLDELDGTQQASSASLQSLLVTIHAPNGLIYCIYRVIFVSSSKLRSQAFPSISWSWSWPSSCLMVPAAASPNPTTMSFILLLVMMKVRALEPTFKRTSYDAFTRISSSVWWSHGTLLNFVMPKTHDLFQHCQKEYLFFRKLKIFPWYYLWTSQQYLTCKWIIKI